MAQIVDPVGKVVEQYLLAAGRFALAGSETRRITPHALPDVVVELNLVW